MTNIPLLDGISLCWLKMLEDSKIRIIALDPQKDRNLMDLLQVQPNWRVASAKKEYVIFARNDRVMGIA